MIVIIGGKAGAKIATELFESENSNVSSYVHGLQHSIKYVETYWDSKQDEQLFSKFEDSVEYLSQPEVEYFVATGDNDMRKSIISYIVDKINKKPINCIHHTAVISPSAKIGHGNLICPGAITYTDAKVGDGTIINTNSVIEHDCVIEDYAQISPGAVICGYANVGECAFVGAGSTLIPHIEVGNNAMVAAGSSVTKNVSSKTLVAGCPAEVKKYDI